MSTFISLNPFVVPANGHQANDETGILTRMQVNPMAVTKTRLFSFTSATPLWTTTNGMTMSNGIPKGVKNDISNSIKP